MTGALSLGRLSAVTFYLLPLFVVQLARSRRDRAAWEIGLDIPAVVAADLLGTLLLARLFPLDTAALLGRALWLAGGAGWAWWRWRQGWRPAWPAGLRAGQLVALALAVYVAWWLSTKLSRPFVIWDRELHIPVVSAIRGQRIPFASAYDPGQAFHYHFTGDALAAMFQVFSCNVLHSSLALSLAHDVMFALIAATVVLLLLSFGVRPVHVLVLGAAATLLSGPCLLRFGVGEPYLGYSYYALYIWGFRPHQHIAMLMFCGVAGALLVRGLLLEGEARWQGVGPLVFMMALLPVTDETSAGVLGLCLGTAWLAEPRLLAPSRRQGILVLLGLALLFIAVNLVLDAALAPGSPVQKMQFVAPRSPGVQQPPLPLTTEDGRIALYADTLPILAGLVGLVVAIWRQPPGKRSRGLLVFGVALSVISVVLMTTVQINDAPPESHRFLTAALFMLPLVGLLVLQRLPPGSIARTAVLAGLTLGAFSTLLWLSHYSKRHATSMAYFQQQAPNLHETDCREWAGSRLGNRPQLSYVESKVFYSYVGCRPVFVAGRRNSYWTIKLTPTPGLAGLRQLQVEMLPAGQPLDAICSAKLAVAQMDPVCAYATAHTRCQAEGTGFRRCVLSAQDRVKVLGGAK